MGRVPSQDSAHPLGTCHGAKTFATVSFFRNLSLPEKRLGAVFGLAAQHHLSIRLEP